MDPPEPLPLGFLKRWGRNIASSLGRALPLTGPKESPDYPPPYVALENQQPAYTPFPSRMIVIDVAGNKRPAALLDTAFVDAMTKGARGNVWHGEDCATLRVNKRALRQFRKWFESEKSRLDTTNQDFVRQPQRRGDFRIGQERVARIESKLRQLERDEDELRKNTGFILREAASHLKDVMAHIQPMFERAGILTPYRAPDDSDQIDPDFLHKYRLANGDEGSSEDSDVNRRDRRNAASNSSALKQISFRRMDVREQRESRRRRGLELTGSTDESEDQDHDRQARRRVRRRRVGRRNARGGRSDESTDRESGYRPTADDPPPLRFSRPDPAIDIEAERRRQLAAARVEDSRDEQQQQGQSAEATAAADERRVRSYILRRRYWDTQNEYTEAERDFDTRVDLRNEEAMRLQQRVNDGEATASDIVAFELQDYVNGQQLTRRLIDAEARFRAARRECQVERVYVFGDDVSSIFPDISEDDTADTDGIATEGRRQILASNLASWQNTLPDFVDSVMADFDVRNPELDEWEAASVRDYDSQSLRGIGTKRQRIDSVLGDVREMHEGAVDHWATTTGKRRMLFHSKDGTQVFSRART